MEDKREQIRGLVREALEQMSGTTAAPQPLRLEGDDHSLDESLKSVITESDVRSLPMKGTLTIRADAILTPSAMDVIREKGIEIQRRQFRSSQAHGKTIAVGADHGGFEMKSRLIDLLKDLGYAVRDFGTASADPVDYPDFAHAVARAVADGVCNLGIIIDGAGIGSCMTANKVPGVRAAMCYDEATARNSREHNYANVLSLGGKMISREMMSSIVRVWLATPEGEERHGKRVAKIMAIEKQYLR